MRHLVGISRLQMLEVHFLLHLVESLLVGFVDADHSLLMELLQNLNQVTLFIQRDIQDVEGVEEQSALDSGIQSSVTVE